MNCPLCDKQAHPYANDQSHGRIRRFFHCKNCFGIFLDPSLFLTSTAEKDIYDNHENHLSSDGYLNFLKKLSDPLETYLTSEMTGLDFGCGPVHAFAHLMTNYKIASYDPYFYSDQTHLEKTYDFILASEVIEHFNRPKDSFELLNGLLKPRGLLALMTQSWSENQDFLKWWYPRDPTHVFFYHQKTINFLKEKYRFESLIETDSVFILRKI